MCARVQSINFLTHKSFTFLYFFLVQRKNLPFIPPLGGTKGGSEVFVKICPASSFYSSVSTLMKFTFFGL